MIFFKCGSLKKYIYTKKQRNGRIFSAVFFVTKIGLMQGRLINISRYLILNNINDNTFMDMISLYLYIKADNRSSRIFFENQKDLLHKLHIGHSRLSKIKNHKLFNTFFRLGNDFIVARRCKFNKIQLTFGIGRYKSPDKRRPIIRLEKNKIHDLDYVLDQIRVALLNNEILNINKRLYDGELNTSSSKEGYPCPKLLSSIRSNESIAKLLNTGITKTKYIINEAVRQKLIVKKENVIHLGIHENPTLYIESFKANNPSMCGKIFSVGKAVIWQLGNSYKTVIKNARNRHYYGQNPIENPKKTEYTHIYNVEHILTPSARKHMAEFLGIKTEVAPDSQPLAQNPADNNSDIKQQIREQLSKTYPCWDGLEARRKSYIVSKYFRAYKAEKRQNQMKKYAESLRSCYDEYSTWNQAKKDEVMNRITYIKEVCEEAGVRIENILSRITYRQRKYNSNNVSKKSIQDIVKEYVSSNNEYSDIMSLFDKDIKTAILTNKYNSLYIESTYAMCYR